MNIQSKQLYLKPDKAKFISMAVLSMIEQLTEGNRLEMFARSNRTGWDAFGNQVENSININLTPCQQ